MAKKTFMADDKCLNDVIEFLEEELTEAGASMKIIMQMDVCIEEVFVNIAHYAYKESIGNVDFDITHNEADNTITFVFTDWGTPFDPLAKEDPDITLSAEERDIGGLGIFICKKTMDDIHYEYTNGSNVLTMVKKI